jgi:4a-hydroxytetrahydrobiopterin dehydratase
MNDPGLADWRLMLHRLVATFRAPSYEDAAALVPRLAAVAGADVDLRPSGVLHLSLPEDGVAGAEAISSLAVEAGLVSEPRSAVATELAVDALDIAAVRPFWRAVLGYVDDGDDAIADPDRIGAAVWFQQMDEPRPQRNRLHVDVTVPHDVAEERIAAALAAGGTLVSDGAARAFWILADPEGNEACICTWQDRD